MTDEADEMSAGSRGSGANHSAISNSWIPVTERQPEGSKSVLLYLDHRDGYGSAAVGYYIGGEFWLYEGDNITCDSAGVDATHWMPLPAPPTDCK